VATGGCPSAAGVDRSASREAGVPPRVAGAWGAGLSGDGRYVAFASYEDDLVAGDTNERADVFRLDRATGQILRMSLDAKGLEFEDHAAQASISADGTRVAFSAGYGVYVRDTGAARTIRASLTIAGTSANDWSGAPVLSPEGRFVAFTSRASNLVSWDRDRGSVEAYLRDLQAGTTERISIGPGGLAAPTWSSAQAVSEGGRYVAFTAGAAGGSLTSADTYPGSDVFLRDRQTKTTETISVAPDGRSMGGWFLGMSADGMKILFGSGPQPDARPAVFLRDRAAGTTRLIAPLVTTWRRSAGTRPTPLSVVGKPDGPTAALSADGRRAAFQTALPTGPDDTNGADDIVVVDLATGIEQPATRSASGCPGNGASGEPTFSWDGSIIAFTSEADDLADSDNQRLTNVFVRDMFAYGTERVRAARQ
jgi:Tol biopolymer transport system component